MSPANLIDLALCRPRFGRLTPGYAKTRRWRAAAALPAWALLAFGLATAHAQQTPFLLQTNTGLPVFISDSHSN